MWTRVHEANLPQYITAEIFGCLKSVHPAGVNEAMLMYVWFYRQGSSGNKGFFSRYTIFLSEIDLCNRDEHTMLKKPKKHKICIKKKNKPSTVT